MQPWEPIEIPAGRDGINRAKNLSLVRPSHLAEADNVIADRFLFEKIPGSAKFNTVALSGPVAAHWYFVVSSVEEVVAYVVGSPNSKLVTVDAGGVVTTLNSALTPFGTTPQFAEGWNGTTKALYMASGTDRIQVHTSGGLSTIDLPSPSPDWGSTTNPICLGATNTRMAASGVFTFPHHVYLSVPGDHNDFVGTDSAVEIMYPGIGEKIVAVKSHKDRLYIGKRPNGIMWLDESDPNIANWTRGIVTDSIGLEGHGCWLDIGDDLLILSSQGYFYLLSQVHTDGQVAVPPLLPMETSEFLKETLLFGALYQTRSIWFGHRRQAWFHIPIVGTIIIDLNEQGNPKVFFSSAHDGKSLTLQRSSVTSVAKPSFGDDDGFIWLADQAARNRDGDGYVGQYETVPVAVTPGGIHRANLEELQVVMQPQGNWDLDIEVLRDGVPSQTIAYSMQTPGAGTGSVSLDSDVIAGQTIATVRHRLEGDCRYIKLIGRNENANENFAVMSHIVRTTQGNERP